jgi:hypothetical protein
MLKALVLNCGLRQFFITDAPNVHRLDGVSPSLNAPNRLSSGRTTLRGATSSEDKYAGRRSGGYYPHDAIARECAGRDMRFVYAIQESDATESVCRSSWTGLP